MKKLMKVGLAYLTIVMIAACASHPHKAPCDEYGTFCGSKTKINHW